LTADLLTGWIVFVLMEGDVRNLTLFVSTAALLGWVAAVSGADKVSQVFVRDII